MLTSPRSCLQPQSSNSSCCSFGSALCSSPAHRWTPPPSKNGTPEHLGQPPFFCQHPQGKGIETLLPIQTQNKCMSNNWRKPRREPMDGNQRGNINTEHQFCIRGIQWFVPPLVFYQAKPAGMLVREENNPEMQENCWCSALHSG